MDAFLLSTSDLKRVKDSRKHFQKMSDEVENAFGRNAQVSKSRVEECEEAGSNLTIARNNFKKSSLDYLFEVRLGNESYFINFL